MSATDVLRWETHPLRREKPAIAMSPAFVDEVTQTFRAARPLIGFLSGAVGVAF